MVINLYVNITGATLLDSGVYQVTKGQSLSFSVIPFSGTAPYAYAWDFGDRSQGDALGDWDLNGALIKYSTDQNPSHTFNEYGLYDVTLYVRDSADPVLTAYSYLTVYVPVGGTVLDPTVDCGINNIVGDGVTDNGTKLANAVTVIGGLVTFDVPSGTYLFCAENTFDYATEIKAKDGASVTFLFDPPEVADLILHLDNNVTDSSSGPHTVTNNNVTFDADDKVTGTHSAIFNGTTAYLSIPNHTDFDFSGGTCETIYRIKLTDLNANYPLYFHETDEDHYFKVYINTDGAVCVNINGVDAAVTDNGDITANTWHTLKILRYGGIYWQIYVDDVWHNLLSGSVPEVYTQDIQIGYDNSNYFKGKIDEIMTYKNAGLVGIMFHAGNMPILRNITFTRKVESNENYTSLLTTWLTSTSGNFQNCTLNELGRIMDNAHNLSLIKCNFLNWGASHGGSQNALAGAAETVFIRDCYFKSINRTAHVVYGGGISIIHLIRNYIDHSTGAAGWTFQGIQPGPAYLFKNFIKSCSGFGPLFSEHCHIIQNIVDTSPFQIYANDASIDWKVISNSIFNTVSMNHVFIVFGGNPNVQIQNNIIGANCIGGAMLLNWFQPYAPEMLICGPNGPTVEHGTLDPNPGLSGDNPDYTGTGINCAVWSGNVHDPDYENPISDPGQWEFTPPTISSISLAGNTLTIDASDSGSGLGSTPRWPLPNASMVQVRYADGTLSEIQAYASETEWSKKPYKFRICDVHQNWTNEAATCPQIQVGTGASINLGSGGSLVLE